MLYQRKSFQVPATNGNPTLCDSSGQHCGPDAKGKCLRCGTFYDQKMVDAERFNREGWVTIAPGVERKELPGNTHTRYSVLANYGR